MLQSFIMYVPSIIISWVLFLPLTTPHKKLFFVKNFFFYKQYKNINFDLFFKNILLVCSVLLCTFTSLIVSCELDSQSMLLTNFVLFNSTVLLLCLVLTLVTLSRWPVLVGWEFLLATWASFLIIIALFSVVNYLHIFMLVEFFSNTVFLVLMWDLKINYRAVKFNSFFKQNILYYQLVLNSWAAAIFIGFIFCVIKNNVLNVFIGNQLFENYLWVLVVLIKVGLGPAFFFKVYVYNNISVLTGWFYSMIYIFLFLFFVYNFYYFGVNFSSPTITLYLIYSVLIIKVYFFNNFNINNFLQFSSFLNINYFLLLFFVDEFFKKKAKSLY